MTEEDKVREVVVSQVLFSAEDKTHIGGVVKRIARLMEETGVEIDDGIAAMMMLTYSHIATLPDEAAADVIAQCVAVMTGNYSFEGGLH